MRQSWQIQGSFAALSEKTQMWQDAEEIKALVAWETIFFVKENSLTYATFKGSWRLILLLQNLGIILTIP